ncbi:hypothetical protein [Pseudobdellovibrio sp. HCB154]|uniref:hypothetical protein n=1 Tax=Pseudobdellovibrio sp. HCB154 TaxID=3386277 RepID=UPI00391724A1
MKRNLILSLAAILGIMLMAQMSFAQGSVQPQTQTKKTKRVQQQQQTIMPPPKMYADVETEELPYKLSAALSLSYEQNAEENSDGIRGRGLGLYFAPKFEYYDFSIRAELFYGYDLNQPSEGSDWADGVVSLLYKGWKLSAIKISPYTSVELPLSKESRENREIELVNNLGVLVALDTKDLNVPDLSLSYSVAYGYYTNKYTTRVNGEPATEYKIVQTVKAGYNFNPVSVSVKFKFTSSYSYEDVVRSGFFLQENISYEVNDTLGFSLYHYNAAPFLKDATYENNLQTYDRETSTVGVSTDLSF